MLKEYSPYLNFYMNAYITYYCNRACKHCLTCSSPKSSKEILPLEDILFYVKEFRKNTGFVNHIVLNGGEPTSAYYHNSHSYMPTLYTELLKNKCNIELHSNAVWAMSKKADIIWQDLKILDNLEKCGICENLLDLSSDQYHNNENGIKESLKILSGPGFGNRKLWTKILSFNNDPIINRIKDYQIKKYPSLRIDYSIFNDIVKTGRAKENNIGIDIPFFEYCTEYNSFVNIWSEFIISLYPDRTASIGCDHSGKRRVSYISRDGKLKPLEQLYPELVNKYINCYQSDGCDLLSVNLLKQTLIPKHAR